MRRSDITGVILAGGQGRRMGGLDKGWAELGGRPFIAHVLERLAPQVGTLMINANQNIERYRALGHPVVTDRVDGFAGPLAGLESALRAAGTSYVLTVPCDSPFLPADLAQRLGAALEAAGADVAVARTGTQPHPVFALVACSLLGSLRDFLAAGGRKIDAWYAPLRVTHAQFDDEADAFANINTREELAQFQRELPRP